MTNGSSELVQWSLAKAGDQVAFGLLYDAHKERVYRHAYRLVGNVSDAQDITASAFLELWRRRIDVRIVDGSILPWLLVTTTFTYRNLSRSLRRYQAFLSSLRRDTASPGAEREYLEAHPLEQLEPQLLKALKDLSTRDLQLLLLVALDGFTVEEASKALGLGLSTAKSRLRRARLSIQDHVTMASDRPAAEGMIR